MSAFTKVRDQLIAQNGASQETPVILLPCRWCSRQTPATVLSNLGARCTSCYEAYCRESLPSATSVPRLPTNMRSEQA